MGMYECFPVIKDCRTYDLEQEATKKNGVVVVRGDRQIRPHANMLVGVTVGAHDPGGLASCARLTYAVDS